jgi:hypothetical protein
MFPYDIHALCPHCGDFHDVLVRVQVPEYFEIRNLQDIYETKLLSPGSLVTVSDAICARTGKRFALPSADNMILVLAAQ